jgi:hypothetical protein
MWKVTWIGKCVEVLSWQADWAGDLVDAWTNSFLTHGIWVESYMVPRGPIMGCHMAPLQCIKFVVVHEGRTPDLVGSGIVFA